MTVLLFAPHADDETLFAAYTCMAEKPRIIVCTDGGSRRRQETLLTASILGCHADMWGFHQWSPDWDGIERRMRALDDGTVGRVFAPAPNFEPNGHSTPTPAGWGVLQHDRVGDAAQRVFGDRVTFYCTYTRWGGREHGPVEVYPRPGFLARKLQAMACYESQIEQRSTLPWFTDWTREWQR